MRRLVRVVLCATAMVASLSACSGSNPSGATQPATAGTGNAAPTTAAAHSVPPLPTPTALPGPADAGDLSPIKATRIPLSYPEELSVIGQTVWAQTGAQLARFDVATSAGELINPMTAGHELDNILATETAVWLADFDGGQVVRLDPAKGQNLAQIKVGAAEDIIDVSGTLWVTNHHEGSVSRIDEQTNTVIDTTMVGQGGSSGPQQLAEGAGSVWVGEGNNHTVIRLEAATGKIIKVIPVPTDFLPCGGILATDTAVWVTACHETPAILRIDPKTNAVVTTIKLDAFAQDPVIIGGEVCVAVAGIGDTHEFERINPRTNAVDKTIDVPGFTDVFGSAIAGGDLWVSNGTDAIFRFPLKELGG